jgi:hypothetical protein
MKRKLPLFLSAAAITIVLISPQTLQARENRGEKHILALGIDYNLNRGEDSFIPILYYNFPHVFRDSPLVRGSGIRQQRHVLRHLCC